MRQTMQRIRHIEGGRRRGGVIWHTQGSGKSLTMVMLAQAIILDKEIRNPKIILVTDRTDLDRQITGTFRKCQIRVENATTGSKLVELLNSKSDAVITTIIKQVRDGRARHPHPVDRPQHLRADRRGTRSQYGEMGIKMEKTLPNACFIAMTGTPLMKKEKNTAGSSAASSSRSTRWIRPWRTRPSCRCCTRGAWCLRWYTRRRLTAISTRFADG